MALKFLKPKQVISEVSPTWKPLGGPPPISPGPKSNFGKKHDVLKGILKAYVNPEFAPSLVSSKDRDFLSSLIHKPLTPKMEMWGAFLAKKFEIGFMGDGWVQVSANRQKALMSLYDNTSPVAMWGDKSGPTPIGVTAGAGSTFKSVRFSTPHIVFELITAKGLHMLVESISTTIPSNSIFEIMTRVFDLLDNPVQHVARHFECPICSKMRCEHKTAFMTALEKKMKG